MNDESPEILTLAEAAEYLRCHPGTVRRLINAVRGIPSFRLGSAIRIKRADLDEWIRKQSR
jgi:excisionase family DNA binding protein